MVIRVFLKDDLTIDKIDGTNLLLVGVNNVKMEVYSPIEIGCSLLIERPDGYVYGPISRNSEAQSGSYRLNKFILDAAVFRKTGSIQCSIQIQINDETRIAYCIFNNMKAVDRYKVGGTANADDIRILVESVNLELDNVAKRLDSVEYLCETFEKNMISKEELVAMTKDDLEKILV